MIMKNRWGESANLRTGVQAPVPDVVEESTSEPVKNDDFRYEFDQMISERLRRMFSQL